MYFENKTLSPVASSELHFKLFLIDASHLSPAVSPARRQRSHQNASFNDTIFFTGVTGMQQLFKVLNSWWKATTKILHLPQIPSTSHCFLAFLFTPTPVERVTQQRKNSIAEIWFKYTNTAAILYLLYFFIFYGL